MVRNISPLPMPENLDGNNKNYGGITFLIFINGVKFVKNIKISSVLGIFIVQKGKMVD
ncbi:MAG: hypothetical protein LBF49_03550 [Puniceicoccales bacterium]|nr:hypothetical protein [Puniceicoccales bacterium]